MRGTWFVRFWEQCKTHVKSKDNSKRWPGRKSYLLNSLKDPTSRTSSWETLRSTARSMKLCWALLSQFEWIWADMSWIFEVKSRHMQNADRLWMLVSGFAAKRNSFNIFYRWSRLWHCVWSLNQCISCWRPTISQSSDEPWCSVLMGTNWSGPRRGRPIWQSCVAC